MLFGIGPVLHYEVVTTARRGRYYLARVVYGLVLLYLLWDQQASWQSFQAARHYSRFLGIAVGGTHEEIRRFAESAFIKFAGVQGLVLLCLVPALIAGVIADEHQHMTLHYLLASRLSSAEIVLGKLAGRLVHVAAFVALGLPVVSLLGLYGGLNPQYVFYSYLATTTTVFLTAALSILISVVARRPRDAILATYGLIAFWLWGPLSIAGVAHAIRGPLFWIGPVNDWLLISSPMVAWSGADSRDRSVLGVPGSHGRTVRLEPVPDDGHSHSPRSPVSRARDRRASAPARQRLARCETANRVGSTAFGTNAINPPSATRQRPCCGTRSWRTGLTVLRAATGRCCGKNGTRPRAAD